MRLINTKAHVIYDYALALLLFLSPSAFGYPSTHPAYKITCFFALILILNSVVTNFEFSPLKMIPIRVHLFVDFMIGAVIASSPWLFSFESLIYKPHLVFGMSLSAVALLTDHVHLVEIHQMMGKNKNQKVTVKSPPSTPAVSLPNFKFIADRLD